jgi:putative transcriptional regulator
MLRFKIKELIGKKEFDDGRRITISEIADTTGIHRMTLSKLLNHKGHSTRSENINSLCKFFNCAIEDLVEYIPE